MSIQTKLYIDDKVYNVKEFSHRLTRGSNPNGMGNNKIRHWGLNIVIEATTDNDNYEWSIEDNFTKNIELRLTPNHIGSTKTRVINAYDCHLLNYTVNFNALDNQPMTETLHLSVGGFKDTNSAVEYSEIWRKTFPNDTEPTVIEEEEPQFLGYYFEDLNNNKIPKSKLKPNQDVVLIIETENADGDTITIDLDDDDLDYEYNGSVLKNDVLEGVTVTGEQTRIELKVVNQN